MGQRGVRREMWSVRGAFEGGWRGASRGSEGLWGTGDCARQSRGSVGHWELSTGHLRRGGVARGHLEGPRGIGQGSQGIRGGMAPGALGEDTQGVREGSQDTDGCPWDTGDCPWTSGNGLWGIVAVCEGRVHGAQGDCVALGGFQGAQRWVPGLVGHVSLHVLWLCRGTQGTEVAGAGISGQISQINTFVFWVFQARAKQEMEMGTDMWV